MVWYCWALPCVRGTPDHVMLALDVWEWLLVCGWRQAWWRLQQNARFLSSKVWWQRFAKAKSKRPAAVCILRRGGRLAMSVRHVRDFPFWTNKLLGRVDTGFPLGTSSRSKAPP
nr:hypothetical protein [uncultured bacterium]